MINTLVDIFADLVACVARTDTSAPDEKNLSVGWCTDKLLGCIDRKVIGQDGNPAAYAHIGHEVLEIIQNERLAPETVVLVGIAIFRGRRLLPANNELEIAISQMAFELDTAIVVLPEGTRKMRCRSLYDYCFGVFRDTYGHFDLAADSQQRAAKEADRLGDAPGAAICRFMETAYRLKDALCCSSMDEANAVFSILEERRASLIEATGGSSFEMQWGQGNGPCQMIKASVWLGLMDHPGWRTWVDTALAAANKLGKAWEPVARFIQAFDLSAGNNHKAEAALQAVASDFKQPNEIRATALLLLARRALAKGKRRHRIRALEFIQHMPETSTQHVRALGAIMLEQ